MKLSACYSNITSHAATTNTRTVKYSVLAITILLLVGCGKSAQEKTTAERLKDSYKELDKEQVAAAAAEKGAVQRRPADFLEDIKAQLDKTRGTGNEAAASSDATTAPTKLDARAPAFITPPTPTPAPAAEAVPAAPVIAPAVEDAPKLKVEANLPIAVSAAPLSPTAVAAPLNPVSAIAAPQPRSESTARAAPQPMPLIIVARREPEFPTEAKQRGIESGVVRARATVSSTGEVVKVEILSANPSRIFDRSVMTALRRWTFNPGANDRTYEGEFNFKQ